MIEAKLLIVKFQLTDASVTY